MHAFESLYLLSYGQGRVETRLGVLPAAHRASVPQHWASEPQTSVITTLHWTMHSTNAYLATRRSSRCTKTLPKITFAFTNEHSTSLVHNKHYTQ